ncbi:WecB/TagA/CpsF family glycosyltransferase, partial [Sulfitobacter sp. M23508]
MKHVDLNTVATSAISALVPQLKTAYLPALDLDLADATEEEAIASLLAPGRRRAFFMNAHCCNIRRHDENYARAVAAADMLLPDGIGVELAGRMTGHKLTANLNGTDLVPALLAKAAQQGKSVYL